MNRTITIKGIGKVSVKPDYIVISMEASAHKASYEETMALAGEQLDQIRGSIISVGFERSDLKTSDFRINADYRNEKDDKFNYKSVFNGYICKQSLSISFNLDMDRMGKLLSALSASSAKPNFSIKFTVKDKDAISSELLENAAENARKKAEILCKAAKAQLGALVNIDYNWGEVNVYSETDCSFDAPVQYCKTINFEPEDIDASDTATFVWEIKE